MDAPADHAAPDGRAYLRLVVLGALIGIPAALVAARRLLPGDGGHRPLAGLDAVPATVFAVSAAWVTARALARPPDDVEAVGA